MCSTYINRYGKLLIGLAVTACATLCLALGSGAVATARPLHVGVPKGVRLIDVTLLTQSGGTATTVGALKAHDYALTNAATIKRVDQLVNGLSTVPDRSYACPMFLLANQPKMTLTFRASANGTALAQIEVNVAVGADHGSGDSPCSPIRFTVRGKAQTALLSKTFVATIGKTIGADIS
jgi:hypothetical protein